LYHTERKKATKNADFSLFFNGFLTFGTPPKPKIQECAIPKLLNDRV